MSPEMTLREAIIEALAYELEHDADVFILGEDVGAGEGVFKATQGLFERFGPDRVLDTPISEQAIVGCALGAAVQGLRPVAEIMFADFSGVCHDQIANELAKYSYMSGGQASVPVVIRMANGGTLGFAAQHSQSVENWFLNVPGLKICVPSNAADAYGLLRQSIQDDAPVLFFEHKALYNRRSPSPSSADPVPFGVARIAREGSDITIVATQLMVERAAEAADVLAKEGIEAEVIDPRTLVPLDLDRIVESVQKTSRLMCVQECPAGGSWGATVAALVTYQAFDFLDAPPGLVSGEDTPIPYSESLERAWVPSVERIATEARLLVVR